MEKFRNNGSSKTDNKATINYLNLIKSNLGIILIISLVIFSITLIYALTASDIYRTSAILKVSEPKNKSVLGNNPMEFAMGTSSTDRYIANEIAVMENRTIRELVAQEVIDSFKQINQENMFDLVFYDDNSLFDDEEKTLRSYKSLAGVFLSSVEIEQKDGLDFIEISVESPTPVEAALIANSYANVYREFNLADSRKQITKVKEFLKSQSDEKFNELVLAEEDLKVYQLQGGGVELGQQAMNLIQTISQFEAQKNQTKIEMGMTRENLIRLQEELKRKNATVSDFMAGQSAAPEIELLREEIAKEQIQRTKAIASASNTDISALVERYDTKINNLNTKLSKLVEGYKAKILATSPDELKQLTESVFQAELKYETLKAQYNQLNQVVSSYDRQFNQLPTRTLELARLERNRQSLEKLYTVLEAKYQEALINEQSTPGNVLIMSDARPPGGPSKPNRPLLAIMGLILGFGVAFSFVFFRDYFDKTVKTPEDIEKESANVLAWIPKFENKIDKSKKYSEIFVGGNAEAAAGESYRTLRTRIQFSKIAEGGKSILITSSAPQEGKTTVASNLAASFAQANKKTILLDCDLRIPRVNEVFGGLKSPGFTNYLFKQVPFEDIIRKTDFENLNYIAAGTIPTNPSEILGSDQMREFMDKLKAEFDIVIIDSPPVMTITDAEVLSHIVDMSILVVFAEKTEIDWLIEATNQLTSHGQKSFIGTVLNNFDYNSGYRSYNKYNHSKYYSRVDETKQKEWVKS